LCGCILQSESGRRYLFIYLVSFPEGAKHGVLKIIRAWVRAYGSKGKSLTLTKLHYGSSQTTFTHVVSIYSLDLWPD
jgi:hypothetical protein